MSLPNGLGYFEYLLLDSLRVKQRQPVSRDFLKCLILQSRTVCDCKYCGKIKLIKQQLKRTVTETNKSCEWWRVIEKWVEITVVPVREI